MPVPVLPKVIIIVFILNRTSWILSHIEIADKTWITVCTYVQVPIRLKLFNMKLLTNLAKLNNAII